MYEIEDLNVFVKFSSNKIYKTFKKVAPCECVVTICRWNYITAENICQLVFYILFVVFNCHRLTNKHSDFQHPKYAKWDAEKRSTYRMSITKILYAKKLSEF